MDRRNFLFTGAGTVAGLTLPGWASAIGILPGESPLAILRPSAIPNAVNVANALAGTLSGIGQSSCQLNVDGSDTQSAISILSAPNCSRWLAILDPAGAVIVGELARSLGLGFRWSGQHAIAGGSTHHHGSVAGLDESFNWQADSQDWEKQLAQFYFGILTGSAPRVQVEAPREEAGQVSLRLACLLLTK
jgi:hypothetical protein